MSHLTRKVLLIVIVSLIEVTSLDLAVRLKILNGSVLSLKHYNS